MSENLNELEEFELDEATLKFLERKYRNKIALSVITVIIALVAVAFSLFVFSGYNNITKIIGNAEALKNNEEYSAALAEYTSAEANAEVPVFKAGSKAFWGHMEAYEKVYGPVECKKLLDKYYPDGEYPQPSASILENAKVFTKAYNELNAVLTGGASKYAQVYEAIEKIGADNPDYPKYVVLYFHLLATQQFEQSPNTQLSAYEALEKEAPDATWLYSYAGTKALIASGELSKALRLCPDEEKEESKQLRIRIMRMMGEYPEAIMLYDEFRDFDIPSETLDRERIILYLLKGDARGALTEFSRYTENLDLCSTKMLYTLQITAMKAADAKLEEKIEKYLKAKKISASTLVADYDMGGKDLTEIFLSGESDLS